MKTRRARLHMESLERRELLSFGNGGVVITDFNPTALDTATAVAVQTDGKIVEAGWVTGNGGQFAVIRYNTDGTLDAGNGPASSSSKGSSVPAIAARPGTSRTQAVDPALAPLLLDHLDVVDAFPKRKRFWIP